VVITIIGPATFAGYDVVIIVTVGLPPDPAFRLASVSKQFTAMAIMVLAESGALAYDDPVSRYLPQLAPYEGVTIRHLMTHTGGLPEYYDVIDTASGMPTNADALVLLGEMGKSDFPPGDRYEYRNPGYDMLAPLVEAASGTDFASFMRERVFRPAGMQHSLIYDHTRPVVPQRAFGYEPNGDGFSLNDDDPLNAIVGSGGVYSTLKDFFRWDQALYTEVLVSRAALDEALTPARLNNGETTDYGFAGGSMNTTAAGASGMGVAGLVSGRTLHAIRTTGFPS
jgi:CubicO group peptidase (beta-lactamase class C family)